MKYNTEKQTEILSLISKNRDKVFSIDEICAVVTPDGKGKSTVYRIISEMVKDGTVRRISDGQTRHVTYQYLNREDCCRHLHLKCHKCGKLIHLDNEISRGFELKVMEARAFLIDSGATLSGICEICRAGGRV